MVDNQIFLGLGLRYHAILKQNSTVPKNLFMSPLSKVKKSTSLVICEYRYGKRKCEIMPCISFLSFLQILTVSKSLLKVLRDLQKRYSVCFLLTIRQCSVWYCNDLIAKSRGVKRGSQASAGFAMMGRAHTITQKNMLCNMILAAQLCSNAWEVHVWAICGVGILIKQGCFSDSRVDRTELWLMHHFGVI